MLEPSFNQILYAKTWIFADTFPLKRPLFSQTMVRTAQGVTVQQTGINFPTPQHPFCIQFPDVLLSECQQTWE